MSSIDLYDMDERFHADRAKRERNLKKKEKEKKSQKDNTEPDPVETFKWTRNKESGRLEKYDVLNDTPQQPVSHPVGWCSKNHYMDLDGVGVGSLVHAVVQWLEIRWGHVGYVSLPDENKQRKR